MKPGCEEIVSGQLNTVDRFLDLPYFIIHRIISFLGTKEAYRTSILSKRWAHISATNPIIELHYYCKGKNSGRRYWATMVVSARLLEHIDTRMQKYDKEKLRIRKLKLVFPNVYKELGCEVEELEFSREFEELSSKVDEWIRIAVCNQVATLDFDGPINYQLPDILLFANSVRRLDCTNVNLPYFNKAINLASLQTLNLFKVVVEEELLNHIIISSLMLKCLSVADCVGFKTIVIPCSSRLEGLTLTETLPKDGTIIIETSSLTEFQISDSHFDDRCPVMSKPGLLKNLTVLGIFFSGITDEDLGRLLPELVSLEILRLSNCLMLRTMRVSCIRLKEIYLIDCIFWENFVIDAPCLTKFKYNGTFDSLSEITVSSQVSCDICVHIAYLLFDTQGFFSLKKLMTGLSNCNALKFSLDDFDQKNEKDIEFIEEELGDVILGPPCEITELKLILPNRKLSRSSITAYLNGLFWTCHPHIISFRVHLKDSNLTIEPLMIELQKMAKCWSHPLKRVEVEGANCSNLLKSSKLDIQFRLYW